MSHGNENHRQLNQCISMRFVPLYLTHTQKFTFVITERIVHDILYGLKII